MVLFVTVILAIKYNRTQMEEVCSVGKLAFLDFNWLVIENGEKFEIMAQFETYLMNFGKFWIETFMVGITAAYSNHAL